MVGSRMVKGLSSFMTEFLVTSPAAVGAIIQELAPQNTCKVWRNPTNLVAFALQREFVQVSQLTAFFTMPAPTALLRRPDELAEAAATPLPDEGKCSFMSSRNQTLTASVDGDTVLIDAGAAGAETGEAQSQPAEPTTTEMHVDEEGRPRFAPAKPVEASRITETRKVPIPPHRMTPLRRAWPKVYPPLVEHLKLQVRMNLKSKSVELRTSKYTTDVGALQKGDDFVRAFTLGFDVDDAIAMLRLDDLYIQTFEIKDVKTLHGEHLGRAIGRIAGKDGKTKYAIENASRTRVVLADSKIHILGGFKNIHIAREAIVSLILGSPPGKVYGNLRTVAARMK